jgi:uncharacterized protein YndB with AHSA1/START domain
MTLITSTSDPDDLTMTMVAEFDAAPERLWDLYEDPRKLERWWGPEPYPATFTRYEFEPGGQCRYYMTGPDDFKHYGWWRIDSIDEPHRIEFTQGLSGEDGEPVPGDQSLSGVVTLERIGSGTRMTVLTRFPDTELMAQMIGGGMQEGMSQAIGQIDALLDAVHAA